MAVLRRSGLDEIVHQPEGVLFIPDVPEGVIAIAFLQVDKVQHPDVVTFAF